MKCPLPFSVANINVDFKNSEKTVCDIFKPSRLPVRSLGHALRHTGELQVLALPISNFNAGDLREDIQHLHLRS